MTNYALIGCGDVGRRLARQLMQNGVSPTSITALVRTDASVHAASQLGVEVWQSDLDSDFRLPAQLHGAHLCYLVPPQKAGLEDNRSKVFLNAMITQKVIPNTVALISTTGVYGNTHGEWVDEATPVNPQTERAKRRLSMEQQWRAWANDHDVNLNVLRVPGIYANSRIPVQRLQARTPVVRAQESGFTNRVHADDLAAACIAAMHYSRSGSNDEPDVKRDEHGDIFNITDGTPGKISDYLQAAAEVAGLAPLPEISLADAQEQLSAGMLSYLSESRRISNKKMLDQLKVALRFPDFREGLRH